ncbi:hypothetical protein L596_030639 [Steinernema carpocapsae]|uniref:Peptidase S1 domain-containing protein n=1 Tax=Steinernema carpocapsae TaxID=34508 RepID=A0A4U5LQ14_STECR|nr:hypothetical protein L596_030639 [Steinernema carpocapsae]
MCGGTLITTTHVLTAGHCTAEMDAPARIMAGSVSLKEQSPNTQWRDIHSIYTYPTYDNDDPLVYDDIAIVEFNPPVSLNRDIQLVKIVKDDTELLKQTAALISGFGTYTYEDRQGEKMGKTSDELLWTQVQLFPWDYCNRQWGRTLNQKQICAGSKGRGTGGGDSGGPIQVPYNKNLYQVGLTSYGAAKPEVAQNEQDRVPSVFTRVSQFCDFIEQVTEGKAKCGSLDDKGGDGPKPTKAPDCTC